MANFYTDLPPWAKAVVIIGGAAVTVYTVHFIYQKIHTANVNKGNLNGQKDENTLAKKEVEKLADKGIRPTITEAYAQILANQLFTAMDGMGTYGYDITMVLKQLKNDADFYLVSQAFGIRTIRSGVIFVSDKKFTLTQALTDELDALDKTAANNALKANGLTIKV